VCVIMGLTVKRARKRGPLVMAKAKIIEGDILLPVETARMARNSMPKEPETGPDGKARKPKKARMTEEERKAWREERDKAQAAEESLIWAEIRNNAKQAEKKAHAKRQGMLHGAVKYNRDKIMPIILDRLSNGESMANICREDGMPPPSTIHHWIAKEPAFAEAYSRARAVMADVLFDQCLAIADDAANDVIHNPETGEAMVNHAAIARAKLKIDTRFRIAGKISSKYADKSPLDGAGVTVNNLTINARDMDAEQRDKLRNLLLIARAGGSTD
jgi:hypothetical protein